MAKLAGALSSKDVHSLLTSHSSINNSLIMLRLAYQQADIADLHLHTTLLQEILISRKELPLTRYNAMLAAHQMLMTARLPAVLFLEIYLLPILKETATVLVRIRREEELETYFIDRGYRQSQDVRKLGPKFVRKAASIVILAASIKPYQNVLNSEISTQSCFQAAAAGFRGSVFGDEGEESPKEIQGLRVTYLKELKGLKARAFGEFVMNKLKQDVVFRQSISINTRKLMESEEAILTIPAINLCVSALTDITRHFPQKKIFLNLLNSFVRKGHIYAIVVVHNAPFLNDIFQEVTSVPGQQGLSAGKLIYPDVEASLQDKLDFYCEFLKCLEMWAVCLPKNEIEEESEVFKFYVYLKQEREFVFPELLLLRRVQEDFNQCLKQKQEKNDQMLKIIETDDKLMVECGRMKSSDIQLSQKLQQMNRKQVLLVQSKHSNSPTNNKDQLPNIQKRLQSLLKEAAIHIQELIYKNKVAENIPHLKSFIKEWKNIKQNHQKDLNLQLLKQGDSIMQRFHIIYPLYIRLKKRTIGFQMFRRKVANVLGFCLQDFGLEDQDHYGMQDSLQSNGYSNEEALNKNITFYSKQSSQLNNITFLSKKKQEEKVHPQKNPFSSIKNITQFVQPPKINSYHTSKSPSQADFSIQQKEDNEYGIQKLLKKRKQYLNSSKQSLKRGESDCTPSLKSILPLSAINHSSENIHPHSSQPISFSQESPSSTSQTPKNPHQVEERNGEENRKMNAFEIYQIHIKENNPKNDNLTQPTLELKINSSDSIRNKFYLQKIRYSSTRKAIEEYSRKTNGSNSSNKTEYNSSSRTTSKSIIHRQYKRINFLNQSPAKTGITNSKQNHHSYDVSYSHSSEKKHSPSIFSDKSHKVDNLIKSVLNTQKYTEYFPKNKDQKLIKNTVKNKGILFSSEDIEIGFVNFRKENSLSFILHLTASKNAQIIEFKVSSSPKLKILFNHCSVRQLRKDKQQIIKIDAIVQGTPFSIPVVRMKLKLHGGELKQVDFLLPATFNKYNLIKSIDHDTQQTFSRSKQTIKALTTSFGITDQRSFFKKLSKALSLSSTIKHHQKGVICICECSFQSKVFIVKCLTEEKGNGILEGFSPTNHTEQLQFFLSTLLFVLNLF